MKFSTIQSAASGWCAIMIALLAAVQFAAPAHPPFVLFLLFIAVWAFGAVMIQARPRFGAVGTAIYGAFLGVDLLVAHGWALLNVGLALASLVGSGLAVGLLVALRRP